MVRRKKYIKKISTSTYFFTFIRIITQIFISSIIMHIKIYDSFYIYTFILSGDIICRFYILVHFILYNNLYNFNNHIIEIKVDDYPRYDFRLKLMIIHDMILD